MPILHRLLKLHETQLQKLQLKVKATGGSEAEVKVPPQPLAALILTPTRELAMQTVDQLTAVARFTSIRVSVLRLCSVL